MASSPRPGPEKVRALVVSGFLGSGKTTLVRDQLARAREQGLRVAVVSNELGELGIDRALFGEGGRGYVELEGGCVCCQLSDALVETLEELRVEVAPDRVIVETSGAALPYETQLQLWREPVSDWVAEDLSLVVVDAEQLHSGRDCAGLFEDQIGSADLLLLNKIDRVPAAALLDLERALADLAPGTAVVRSERARVNPDLLFLPPPEEVRRARERRGAPGHAHRHDAFEARVEDVPAGSAEELRAKLAASAAVRVKGFVRTERGVELVQGVGERIELEPAPVAVPAELVGKLVVIRRRLA